jgi:hypothetical protein
MLEIAPVVGFLAKLKAGCEKRWKRSVPQFMPENLLKMKMKR